MIAIKPVRGAGRALIVALTPFVAAASELPPAATRPVDFARDIQPIFAERCLQCHSAEKQKGGLRLDQRPALLRGGDSGQAALVVGRSSESKLIHLVAALDPDEVMPPKGELLSAEQVALLRAWIDQGAPWSEEPRAERKHWAFEKPLRPTLPEVKDRKWPRNPIDHFVLARLEKERLTPSPPAERAGWLRRVSLDLIGLPPTVEEVDGFISDTSDDAFEKVVDHLLRSPDYGVRWARPWLDAARYADTQGYEKDNRRSLWPYRDWVVSALNRNLLFDQFTIEQLAGDLLPHATQEQKVATGFHRNTMTNTEGGTDDEEFRHEAVADRVDTTFSVWMGTTMACARCHNHKYDPLTMREYYQAYAFFNNTADADRDDEAPTLKVFAPGQEERLAQLRAATNAAEQAFAEAIARPEVITRADAWAKDVARFLTSWHTLDPDSFVSTGGATLSKTASKSIVAGGKNPSNDSYVVTAPVSAGRITGVRLEVLETGSDKALGRHPNGSFVLSKFEAAFTPALGGEPQPLRFDQATADYTQNGHNVADLLTGQGSGWAVGAADQARRVRRSAYFKPAQPLRASEGGSLTVTLRHTVEYPEANVARFRLYTTSEEDFQPPPALPDGVRAALIKPPDQRDEKQRAKILEHYGSVAPELKGVHETREAARKAEKDFDESIPSTAVMAELEKPRPTHLLSRGSFMSKGEPVTPGTPSIFHPLPKDQPLNRLTFARWLVDTNNPLTARVIINRVWEQYFGRGLVETVENFGTQAEGPSHPELLDWLATELMRTGWDLKRMHRLIVLSATYRQAARVTPELFERDPFNRLYTRGPRVRLEAEQLRDQALAIAGLLSHKLGGPSVMPPQPNGLWQIVYSGDQWKTSPGEDKYRRGLYTFWRRTTPYPLMTAFDGPSREYCVLRRLRSNTPLQALNLLNDTVFIESAQALARRVASKTGSVTDRMIYAFRLCLARTPTNEELERLVRLYRTELSHYEQHAAAAESMAASALGPPKTGGRLEELAAWTVVANVLLNLDEVITKG